MDGEACTADVLLEISSVLILHFIRFFVLWKMEVTSSQDPITAIFGKHAVERGQRSSLTGTIVTNKCS